MITLREISSGKTFEAYPVDAREILQSDNYVVVEGKRPEPDDFFLPKPPGSKKVEIVNVDGTKTLVEPLDAREAAQNPEYMVSEPAAPPIVDGVAGKEISDGRRRRKR